MKNWQTVAKNKGNTSSYKFNVKKLGVRQLDPYHKLL